MASTVNMSTSDFLARLELDGRARARPQRHGYWTLALGAALGVSAWFLLHNQGGARSAFAHALPAPVEAKAGASAVPDEVPRRAIAAPELPAAATAAALQATGYVVARRAATVSARTTAAVQAVYVDDGSYVRAGAAMAQLDDRVKRAQYELATAQLKAANARVVEVDAQIQAAQQRLERLTALTARRMASQASLDDETANLRGQRARRARRQTPAGAKAGTGRLCYSRTLRRCSDASNRPAGGDRIANFRWRRIHSYWHRNPR
jgi:multidrug efflux pump subunit AcrA (membrane-fusion protein)